MSEGPKKKKKSKLITLPPKEPDPGLTIVFELDQKIFEKPGEVVPIVRALRQGAKEFFK